MFVPRLCQGVAKTGVPVEDGSAGVECEGLDVF